MIRTKGAGPDGLPKKTCLCNVNWGYSTPTHDIVAPMNVLPVRMADPGVDCGSEKR